MKILCKNQLRFQVSESKTLKRKNFKQPLTRHRLQPILMIFYFLSANAQRLGITVIGIPSALPRTTASKWESARRSLGMFF